jgi:protein SCO1/2
VDSTVQYISKYHTIGDFSFVNQNGKTHHSKDEGKIYVADFSTYLQGPFVQNDCQFI